MSDEVDQLFCPDCGYDLRGQTEERCPECGFHYDRPALLAMNRRAFNDGMHPFLDAVPLLVTSAAISVLSHATLARGLLFLPVVIMALLVFRWLQEWFVRGAGAAGRSEATSIWRATVSGLWPGDMGDLLRTLLFLAVMDVLVMLSGLSSDAAAAISGIPLLIGAYWTLIGFLRYQDLDGRNLLRAFGAARAAALKRAGTTCIVLVGLDVLLWLMISLAL
jgi:hypothetical protein